MTTIPEALAIAVGHHQAGRLQAAEQIYRQVLAADPNQPDAWHLLGIIADQVGKHATAVEHIAHAIRLAGDQAVFHQSLGDAYLALGRTADAVSCYQRALELKPDYAEAQRRLRDAIADRPGLAPRSADELNGLGITLAQQGRLEEAIADFRRALEINPDLAQAHHNLGIALQEQGRLEEAVASYRRALELKPDYTTAYHYLGTALKDLNRLDEAVACYRRALELKPDFVEACNNLAAVLQDQRRLAEAIACYRRVLQYKPDDPIACNNLGAVLQQQGQSAEAAACCRRALKLKPDFIEAHYNLGDALRGQGKLDEAVVSYRRTLELKPDLVDAHYHLGAALKEQRKLDEAVACFRRTLELKPNDAEVHNNLGIVLNDQGKPDEAIACFHRALELMPGFLEAHNNLGVTLNGQGKPEEAMACYRRALELKPDYVPAHNNLGNALMNAGKLDEAIACYRRALELEPDYAEAHSNRSLASLLMGNFEDGWSEYDWRWKANNFAQPVFSQPLWDGRPLEGRAILLYAEQGLGDTIHFVRYAAQVKQRGGSVVVKCPRPLLYLLRSCAGIDRLVAEGEELPPFGVQAPLLSLPGIFHTTLENLPATVPYLYAEPDLVQRWQQELDRLAGFKIGIAWQGSRKHPKDRDRSIPLGCFEPLARCCGVRLLSLQKHSGTEQIQEVAQRFPIIDLASRLDEASGAFMDTAAVMKTLDLVITCDTAVAHLAGALGVPVWVALPLVPDWRWLLDRSDSPWYPTMRLFRQESHGDWPGVFRRIEVALGERLAGRAMRPAEES
jgi:tetratricopeptide (TPR) repeat protein